MIRKLFLLLMAAQTCSSPAWSQQENTLWYRQPAKLWTEALPLGNGRLGAMVFGGIQDELLQLNEGSLWTGGPVRTNVNPGAYSNLQIVRQALLQEEDYARAYEYAKKMQGYYSESFLPMADLFIHQNLPGTATASYYRDLNIADAMATTRFTVNGTVFTRQVFISAPDQVIIVRLRASRPGQINCTAGINGLLSYQKSVSGNSVLVAKGKAPSHIEPNYVRSGNPIITDTTGCRGMRFQILLKAIPSGGSMTADTAGITINHANEVLLVLSAATSFNGFNKCPDAEGRDEQAIARRYLDAAVKKNWQQLLQNHLSDYHRYFNRVSFRLEAPAANGNASLPTDERLLHYTEGTADPMLETLYFRYGRYLLISCSRPGGLPANLQGIWNKELRPPWSSNYTTNINVQMNYWPAEPLNLSEMHLPLMDFIQTTAVTGAVTAREFYHAGGWAVHHNSDIWALSNPVGDLGKGDPTWASWSMGSPWLSHHLWEHYAFTKDRKFLKETAYPLMKGAAAFCLDWLVEDKNGYLVTAPSVSPENTFIDEQGRKGSVSVATTMDMSIIRDLFTHCIEASVALQEDTAFRSLLMAKQQKLFPLQIGKKGNLQEWYKDWEDVDPHHRHVSHLFGLYPGNEISPLHTLRWAAAARKTLELRGDAGTGWSLAWKINFWARLLDGNHAYTMVRKLLHLTGQTGTQYANGGGSYVNLFDAHPPFQIDGNFGGVAGMSEMLLQSQDGEIALLPALPDAWKTGMVSGLKARGNFEVSMQWRNNALTHAQVIAVAGGTCRIRTAHAVKVDGLNRQSVAGPGGYTVEFLTEKGKKYTLSAL